MIKDRQGATAIEYALIASLISIAIIGSLTFFSGGVSDMFNNVSNTLQSNI
ncbi:MAG: Flp family type IVb pilin [Rhodospirillales bacterium]|nr:Flp family type IVb pilin [Rhodospirillales bacterium]